MVSVLGAVVTTGTLAHTIHYGLVVVGVVGLGTILLPHTVHRGSAATSPPARPARDVHESRVVALRRRAADGDLATLTSLGPIEGIVAPPPTDPLATLWLPLALVGSTTAAGVHAAIGPAHLGVLPAFGVFFVGCALAQLGWSALLLLRPSRPLLLAGVVGNAALLLLWAGSRTVGLPGILPRREPVGAWDLLCAACEVLAVTACLVLLRRTRDRRLPAMTPWLDWHGRAHAVAALGVAALLLASVSGAPA